MSTSGVLLARLESPTAVVASCAIRMSKPSSGRSRACRRVSNGSVNVWGRTLRASTRRTTTPASRVSPTEPFRGARTVTSCPRAASAAQEAAASRAEPAWRSGNHWSMATRILMSAREPSVDELEQPLGARLPGVGLRELTSPGDCLLRVVREGSLDGLDESLRTLREDHIGLHATERRHSAGDDRLAGSEVLEHLERRAVAGVVVRPVRNDSDVEGRDVAGELFVGAKAEAVDVREVGETRVGAPRVRRDRPDENEAPVGSHPRDRGKQVEVHLLRGEVSCEADDGSRQRTDLRRGSVRMREMVVVGAVANEMRVRIAGELALVELVRGREDDL